MLRFIGGLAFTLAALQGVITIWAVVRALQCLFGVGSFKGQDNSTRNWGVFVLGGAALLSLCLISIYLSAYRALRGS
jgi:hypothetical protein